MANKPKYMRPAATRAVNVLVEHLEQHGAIPPQMLTDQARLTGYSSRHLRRLLNARLAGDGTNGTSGFEVTDDVVTAVFLACGCMARAHRLLARAGTAVPSLSTFKRRVKAAIGTAQLEYARGGSAAFRNAQAYLTSGYPHRLHSVLLDHTELPIWVVPRGAKTADKPWMTAVMDAKSRYLLGWAITFGRPTAVEVRASLMSAMTVRFAPDR
ncbi:MAG: hypothetical protein M0T80_15735, partial [Actinomycetota bacterium]|nr:hypothetical protein [Actinomycetota bacterium]